MRENNYGKIVNIFSMGVKVWTPFGGWYHATKFAVEGFSDCLRMKVKPFGIAVVVIEPGGVTTDWGIIAAETFKKASEKGAYAQAAEKSSGGMKKNYTGDSMTNPEVIARCIAQAVTILKPKTLYLLGYGAKPAVFIKKVFGDRVYDRFIQSIL